MKREKIKIVHRYEDMFDIRYTYHEETEGGGYECIHLSALDGLYSLILDSCNRLFGTDFSVDKKVADRAEKAIGKPESKENIGIEYGWTLKKVSGESYELLHRYSYREWEYGVLYSTCGVWSREEMIELAERLDEFYKENDVHLIASNALKAKYDMYNKMGILSTQIIRPSNF